MPVTKQLVKIEGQTSKSGRQVHPFFARRLKTIGEPSSNINKMNVIEVENHVSSTIGKNIKLSITDPNLRMDLKRYNQAGYNFFKDYDSPKELDAVRDWGKELTSLHKEYGTVFNNCIGLISTTEHVVPPQVIPVKNAPLAGFTLSPENSRGEIQIKFGIDKDLLKIKKESNFNTGGSYKSLISHEFGHTLGLYLTSSTFENAVKQQYKAASGSDNLPQRIKDAIKNGNKRFGIGDHHIEGLSEMSIADIHNDFIESNIQHENLLCEYVRTRTGNNLKSAEAQAEGFVLIRAGEEEKSTYATNQKKYLDFLKSIGGLITLNSNERFNALTNDGKTQYYSILLNESKKANLTKLSDIISNKIHDLNKVETNLKKHKTLKKPKL